MSRDLAEALRRDDLWVDGDARYLVIDTVCPGRHSSRDPEVVLVELGGALLQALCVEDEDAVLRGLVPLSFGPVREQAGRWI